MNIQIRDLQTLKDYNIDVDIIKFLYKRTSTGAIQIWGQQLLQNKYRSVLGQLEGKLQVSDWTTAKPKNIGKKNERLGPEQAKSEVDNNYTKKLKECYFESIEDIDSSTIIFPMLALDWKKEGPKLIEGKEQEVYLSLKLDGYRCIATKDGLFSREGNEFISCDHINEQLKPFFLNNPDVVLDGELYNKEIGFNAIKSIVDRDYNSDEDLNKLYNRKPRPMKKDKVTKELYFDKLDQYLISYHIYDLVDTTKPFSERRLSLATRFNTQELKQYFNIECLGNNEIQQHWNLVFLDSDIYSSKDIEGIDKHFYKALADGYEGNIVRLNVVYQKGKRNKYLLKRKEWIDSEYTLVDMLEGEGNWSGKARIAVFDGFNADIVGTYEQCAEWLKNKDLYIGKPTTIKYFELTEDGAPRFGKVKELDRKI
jgi:DNA ligase-1